MAIYLITRVYMWLSPGDTFISLGFEQFYLDDFPHLIYAVLFLVSCSDLRPLLRRTKESLHSNQCYSDFWFSVVNSKVSYKETQGNFFFSNF